MDLGLPNGTLWATCNLGASNPEDYGSYYMWGVTNTLDSDKWWNNDSNWPTSKPISKLESHGVIDANGNLTTQYDATVANWGNGWRMPTIDEIEELLMLDNECVEANGVKGRKFIGKNGNSLFLPFAGKIYSDTKENNNVGKSGYYWASTADGYFNCLLGMFIEPDEVFWADLSRYDKCSIRPVRKR